MQYIWQVLPTGSWVTQLVVLTVVFVLFIFSFVKVVKRKIPLAILIFGSALSLFSFLFVLNYLFIASGLIVACCVIVTIVINLGSFRKMLANPFKVSKVEKTKFVLDKAFDKEAMYKAVETAVIGFSKDRTGAIITFEKNTSLADVIKNGVAVNAPVSTELLQTIFYPGTRLHDGAVVIHKDSIVAASVFYTPTTKAFAGKYGSRHRAAIGISEISDAVTVVVSEETGRISFAINGELESVEPSKFLRAFTNYMDSIQEE